MPNSCDSKPFQARMVPSLTPCFSVCFVSCSTPRVRVCSPGIPLVTPVGTVKPDMCVNCSNSHVNRTISAACFKTQPSENQIFVLAFPGVLAPAGTSHCSSCMFKPKVCMLTGGVEFTWNVLSSSTFGEMHFFLGLDLQVVLWCGAGLPGQPGCPGPAEELILVTQQWQTQNSYCCG